MSDTGALADIDLKVRPISQHGVIDLPTTAKNNACWYAAAMMVLDYRSPLLSLELVNIRTIARKLANEGLQSNYLRQFAAEVGLEHAPAQHLFPRVVAEEWHAALSRLGPLMVVINRHLVVVRGLRMRDGDWELVYNDPFVGAAVSKAVWRFNCEVDWNLPMLYLRSAHRPPLLAAG